jgi:transmembrane 9 superfamily member 2/4
LDSIVVFGGFTYKMRALLYAALLVLIQTTFGFYISSTVKSYRRGEQIPLYVDKLFSERTLLPYAYKDLKFTCPVSPQDSTLNLGEVLSGDRIAQSTIAVSGSG